MKRFTFEMFIEDDELNMIQSHIDELMSDAAYYAKKFEFKMEDWNKILDYGGQICNHCGKWDLPDDNSCNGCPLGDNKCH